MAQVSDEKTYVEIPFIRSSVITNLREKQRLLQIERFEILARYQASNVEELNHKITEGSAPEHPA